MKRQQDPEFIQQTIDVWQPCSKEKLTETDAIEIITNMTGLFKVLMRIDVRLKLAGSEQSSEVNDVQSTEGSR